MTSHPRLSFECCSLLRQWIGHQRELFCPPSSYSSSSRSSYTLIDATPDQETYNSQQWVRKTDVFHRVVVCNQSSASNDGLTHCKRRERMLLTTETFAEYFAARYEKESPYACVYWSMADGSVDEPGLDNVLNHTQHPVPLVIVALSASSTSTALLNKLQNLATHHALETSIGADNNLWFLLLARGKGSQQQTLSSDNSSAYEKHHRISWILNHKDSHLRQRLRQIMDAQLYKCVGAQQLLADRLQQLNQQSPPLDDELIYDDLRVFYHDTLMKMDECKHLQSGESGDNTEGRANSRVRDIMDLLVKERVPVGSLLDLGCSEGSITAAVGHALHLPPGRIHGCDVREPRSVTGFTFQQVAAEAKLPYEDDQFPCVMTLMSLHHIDDVNLTLKEIYRVMRPGGVLIVREHDLFSPALTAVLDVLHGLHARTWSSPPEQPTFCDDYHAHYRPRKEWQTLMEDVGFKQSSHSPDAMEQPWDRSVVKRERNGFIRNPFAFYWAVYLKPRT